jgi:PAS domain S-box-containing protein
MMAKKPTYKELEQRIKELEKETDERKRLEKDLRESKHYHRSLLNNMHEDILIIDRDYRITDVNRTFLVTSGRTREEVIGRHCYEISHGYNEPCEKHGEECILSKVFATKKPHTFSHQHRHAEGWKVWVDILMSPLMDEEGKVTHVIEAMRDMTDLIKAGRALEHSEEKYRHLVESTQDWVWSIDKEGRITFSNGAIKHLLGYEVQEIEGTSSFLPMHPDDRERFQKLYHRAVEQKHGWKNAVIRWLHQDGTVRLFESNAEPIQDSEGHLIGYTGIDRDITENKRTEKVFRQ